MATAETTCWTVIRGAAGGDARDRGVFAQYYRGAVEAYLRARWGGKRIGQEVADAVQEVFVECFREGGALEKVDSDRPGGFRAFLYGVVRNVAMRYEQKAGRRREEAGMSGVLSEQADTEDARLSRVFDRAWAQSLMRQAAVRQAEVARDRGEDAVRRVELLRMRFQEGLPIREIAAVWGVDATQLHREYAKARKEFREALIEVVRFHSPGSPGDVERESAALLAMLA